ncbi:MAG: hypothetical protein OSA42_01990, partial [Porticoccaceae bacterium]|nr:hypothetical protein [Porticoccaceae bacterium]
MDKVIWKLIIEAMGGMKLKIDWCLHRKIVSRNLANHHFTGVAWRELARAIEPAKLKISAAKVLLVTSMLS